MGRRVLITQQFMRGWTGSEIVTRDLAIGLLRRGCTPVVYTHEAGKSAAALREASVPVIEDLALIGEPPDLIHAHHHPVMAAAIARFPDVPVVAAHQDFVHWLDAPQTFPSIRRWIAVDRAIVDRLVLEGGLPANRVELILNAVDMRRFAPGPPLPETPRHALAFAKNSGHMEAITAACRQAGIELDWVGEAVDRVSDRIESMLPRYDLVFTSALSALEAMACGRAVIVCDGRGLAGFCTEERWGDWRPYNFGLRALSTAVTADAILQELALYSASEAAAASALTRADADLDVRVGRILGIHDEALAGHEPVDPRATLRTLSRYLHDWTPSTDGRWPWMIERETLIEAVANAQAGLDRVPEGAPVSLGAEHDSRLVQLVSGFHQPEPWGVWTTEGPAVISLRLPGEGRFELSVVAGSLVQAQVRAAISVNGVACAEWVFEPGDGPAARTVVIPPGQVAQDGRVWVTIAPSVSFVPAHYGLGADDRRLSLALSNVSARRMS